MINKRRKYKSSIIVIINRLPIVVGLMSILSFLSFLYDIGFEHHSEEFDIIQSMYTSTIIMGIISIISRYIFKKTRPVLKVKIFEIVLVCLLIVLSVQQFSPKFLSSVYAFNHVFWLYISIIIIFIREYSAIKINIKRTVVNPARLFIYSFLTIIVIGTFLLMLPKATYSGISFIDSLFTATSAVCVTGLVVVDTGRYFTHFGQIVILILIQLGGLGVMTFASYFSFFFRGISSYENQFALSEMVNTERIGEIFFILKKIILITFVVEGIGALLIYQTIDIAIVQSFSEGVFFSIFHSISGFCNAGFSTLQNSFYDLAYRFNYSLQLIIASLIILGGIGFPIVFNLLRYVKIKIISFVLALFRLKDSVSIPWLINVNTRIVLITSFILIVFGTSIFFVLEYDNCLSNHNLMGKIITAFFQSVTTRTAGFNTVDTSLLSTPSVLIAIFLMWIGASPGSTGGGIKTSTFAVAILNVASLAKGKSRLEIYNREISQTTVNRASAIILLSIIVIGISIVCLSYFEPEKLLLDIIFESFSAYGTVGLSRGITANLCDASKIVLVFTMFIGRISMLTILIAVFKKLYSMRYRYPSENILIN